MELTINLIIINLNFLIRLIFIMFNIIYISLNNKFN